MADVAPAAVKPSQYRPDVDGLRAVAVIAVLIYHIDEAMLPGGFRGVDIFFVISGYVVLGSMLNHTKDTACGLLLDFFARALSIGVRAHSAAPHWMRCAARLCVASLTLYFVRQWPDTKGAPPLYLTPLPNGSFPWCPPD